MAIKESLLTVVNSISDSDFVRAVTSAGASRKLSVSNLAKHIVETYSGSTIAGSAQSVKSAVDDNYQRIMMPSNIIPSGSTVETYANGLSKGFHTVCNSSSSTATTQGAPFTTPCTYYITVYTVNEHIQIICQPWNPNVANSKTLAVKTKYGGTWSDWTIMPTRTEVDSLNSKSYGTLTSTHTLVAGQCYLIKCGNMVTLTMGVTLTSDVSGYGVIATIPSGYRPNKQIWGQGINCEFDLTMSGNVRLTSAKSSGQSFNLSATYIAA